MRVSDAVRAGMPLRGVYERGKRAGEERDFVVLAFLRRLPPSGKRAKPGKIEPGELAVLVFDPDAHHHSRPFSTCAVGELWVMAVLTGPVAEQITAQAKAWWRSVGAAPPGGFEKEWDVLSGTVPPPDADFLRRDVPVIHK